MNVGGLFERQEFPISACISNSLSKYFSHKSKRDKPKVNNMTIDRNSELNMTLKSGWTIFWKESLNINFQLLIPNQWIQKGPRHPGPVSEQTHKCGRIKPINETPILCSLYFMHGKINKYENKSNFCNSYMYKSVCNYFLITTKPASLFPDKIAWLGICFIYINLVSLVTLRSSGTDILYGCHLLLDVCIIYFIFCD